MTYELRHFDTPLMRFIATEDTSTPEIEILWVNEEKKMFMEIAKNGASFFFKYARLGGLQIA